MDKRKDVKNLMIFVNPTGRFFSSAVDNETDVLVKVQIDNSLDLGWKKEDILLITNFDYEYGGVKAMVVGGENYCGFSPTATKINAIIYLFEQGVIGKDLYWFHDFDAFQLGWITEREIELGDMDFGLTEYGRTTMNARRDKRLSTGSVFFRKSARDIFEWIKIKVYQYECNEEVALLELTKIPKYTLKDRIKRLNITYNFATRKRDISESFEIALKPLKVIHFHPFDRRPLDREGNNNNMDVCVYGRNRLNKVLASEGLIEIFNKHGIV